jgi:hypothetical protein
VTTTTKTQTVSVKMPKPVLDVLAVMGKEHNRSGAGELREAATAWIATHGKDDAAEQQDTPGPHGAIETEETGTAGLNLTIIASMFGTLSALAAHHRRDLNGEVRAAIRAWFRVARARFGVCAAR